VRDGFREKFFNKKMGAEYAYEFSVGFDVCRGVEPWRLERDPYARFVFACGGVRFGRVPNRV